MEELFHQKSQVLFINWYQRHCKSFTGSIWILTPCIPWTP